MRTKFKGLWTLLLALVVQISFAQEKKVSGTVTDASTGEPLPSVNVVVQGTQKGTVTDFDGKYSIMASPDDVLVFSFTGYNEKKVKVGNQSVINVKLVPGEQLDVITVDITGEPVDKANLSYSRQSIKASDLNVGDLKDVRQAMQAKFSNVQVLDQAGSKLSGHSRLRIRQALSLTSDGEPLYVVDGVRGVNPDMIDPENIANIEVLKGPNATAIWGQEGENGVVIITTKKAKAGTFGVDINSKVTFSKVAYLPKYQNKYGEGYFGDAEFTFAGTYGPSYYGFALWPEWTTGTFDGARFTLMSSADESWGPKYDDQPYMPWYAWIPGSPYFGKSEPYSAHPDNVKNFFDTGALYQNNVTITSANQNYSARFSFSNKYQKGIMPYTSANRYIYDFNFDYNVTKRLKVTTGVTYTLDKIHGDFNDDYANQTTGSFNQWFARNLDMKKMRELVDLKTPEGYFASWNWWGPLNSWVAQNIFGVAATTPESYKKNVFWFNPYTWLKYYQRDRKPKRFLGHLSAKYELSKAWTLKFRAGRYQSNFFDEFKTPYSIEYSSAHDLFQEYVNSFGQDYQYYTRDNYDGFLMYNNKINDDLKLDGFIGTSLRVEHFNRILNWMDNQNPSDGLVIPDVYRFDNTKQPAVPTLQASRKKVYSLYGKVAAHYADLLTLEVTGRQDWSSALFPDHNGYFYPSVGATFNFTNLDFFDNDNVKKIISSGTFRIGWAQVGSDVAAHRIYPVYPLGANVPYNGNAPMVTPATLVDPNLHPALNSSFEAGLDAKFLQDRIGLNLTYYYDKRKDEIISQSISNATGYRYYLTNGGLTHRSGIELSLQTVPYKSKDFTWGLDINFAHNKTIVDEVPGDATEMLAPGGRWWSGGDTWRRIQLVQVEGEEWGQIKGYDIRYDDNGNPVVNDNGLYVKSAEQKYFGSVLPKFTGGIINTLQYKDFTLRAVLSFQKGGLFYSGSEFWGWYSGLYEETAKGSIREDGVHVTGTKLSDGTAYDDYVDAETYFDQYYANKIVTPFLHDASYLKLREVSLTYKLPKKFLGKYLKGASIGLIGSNLWLISVSKDNYHRWDPSELSQTYGEDGQLPGTRNFGMNIKLSF